MQQQQGSVMGMIFPIVLFIGIFYFLILRPQKKKQRQHDQMLSSIGRGDTIVTAGGFFGVVREILDDSFLIEVADGVKMRILKSSVSVKRDAGESSGAPKPMRKKKRPRPEGSAPSTADQNNGGDAIDDEAVSNEEAAALEPVVEETTPEAPVEEPEKKD